MRSTRTMLSLVSLMAAGTMLVGCGSSSSTKTASTSSPVTLRIGLFGTFGFKESGLYSQFEKQHPNIKIVEDDAEQEANYWSALRTHLASGSGVDDIQGIEIGRIADAAGPMSSAFTDLRSLGASKDLANFSKVKEAPATTSSGAVVGLGTDIGPMGICYRTDLMKKANLPTDPAALATAWNSWQAYLQMGQKYKVAHSAWMDDAAGMYNAVVSQSPEQYYDSSHTMVLGTNPVVKNAWNLAVQANSEGLTAKLQQFQTGWNKGFASGAFATIACPAWMIGYIKTQAGQSGSGKWNVTSIPGAAGDWGGSYLGIPKASKHPKEAYQLVQFLTSAASQAKVFTTVGNYPSNLGAQQQIAGTTDSYFNNAPIGQLFGKAAQSMPTVMVGHNWDTLGNDVGNGLVAIETQHKDPNAEWQSVVKQATSDAAAQ
jgi:cellobiose transport system substrate-binding protein